MKSAEHASVMGVLRKMKKTAVWQRMRKKNGVIKEISFTKAGNIRLILRAAGEDFTCYVLKRNKNLFGVASVLQNGVQVNIALRRALGKWYCTQISAQKDKTLNQY